MRRTGPTDKVRYRVVMRDRQLCARCAQIGFEVHHRRSRGMGGTRDPEINSMSNLVSLCVQCHKWITEHPAESYETGWSIRRSSGHVPEEVPLTDAWGYQFFLTSDGGVVRIGNINRSKP